MEHSMLNTQWSMINCLKSMNVSPWILKIENWVLNISWRRTPIPPASLWWLRKFTNHYQDSPGRWWNIQCSTLNDQWSIAWNQWTFLPEYWKLKIECWIFHGDERRFPRRVSGDYESSRIITRTRRVDDGTFNAQHSMINDQLPEINERFSLNIENWKLSVEYFMETNADSPGESLVITKVHESLPGLAG